MKAHVTIDERGISLILEPEDAADREVERTLWNALQRPRRIVEVSDNLRRPAGFCERQTPFGTMLRLE